MSYAHPYLTSNGTIMYHFSPTPCPDSKKWKVLGTALEQNTKKLYENIFQKNFNEKLEEEALQLYILSVTYNNYLQQPEEIEVIIINTLKNIVGNKTNKNNSKRYNSKRYRNKTKNNKENKKKKVLILKI